MIQLLTDNDPVEDDSIISEIKDDIRKEVIYVVVTFHSLSTRNSLTISGWVKGRTFHGPALVFIMG